MRSTLAVVAALGLVATFVGGARSTVAHASGTPPNIIVIMTDDQRWDTLQYMPQVDHLQDEGTTFPNAFVPNSLCCPSRASTFSGLYSHTTGVYGNTMPFGGFDAFHDDTTIATALHDAGYRTMLVGKYLNGYPDGHYDYVPPGWDRWFAADGGVYYDWRAADNGVRSRFYGERPDDYSGRVFTSKAISYMQETSSDQPFFLYYAPTAPHGAEGGSVVDPGLHTPTPDPVDVNSYRGIERWRPPSFGLRDDVTDMPDYVRRRAWDRDDSRYVDLFRRRQLETLRGVDRNVAQLLEAAPANTLVIFTSDNGFMWGEHRRMNKQVPYEESIRIPLIIAGPGVPLGVDDDIALNIDVTTTIAVAAGIDPAVVPLGTDRSGEPVLSEGIDLLGAETRSGFVLEHWDAQEKVPGYCGVRTSQYMYAHYSDPAFPEDVGFEELYDIAADPYEQTNLASEAGSAELLAALRTRAQELCAPVPPDFSW